MADSNEFRSRIQERLSLAAGKRAERLQTIARQMTELDHRHEAFDRVADRLLDEIVRPRMEELARSFENARLSCGRDVGQHACSCTFTYTSRFPAAVRFLIGLSPNPEIDTLLVFFDLRVLPVYMEFERHAQESLPLDDVDDAKVATAVETWILQFIETYLRIEDSAAYQKPNLVIDPVCGMRIRQHEAAATETFEGREYFFCAEECRTHFVEEPSRYVHVKDVTPSAERPEP